jgi:hypothetical protein
MEGKCMSDMSVKLYAIGYEFNEELSLYYRNSYIMNIKYIDKHIVFIKDYAHEK